MLRVPGTQLADRYENNLRVLLSPAQICCAIGGEIDTFETYNLAAHNQMTLHTQAGCKQVSAVQTSTVVNSTDCSYLANSNAGCSVMDPDDASDGAKFASP